MRQPDDYTERDAELYRMSQEIQELVSALDDFDRFQGNEGNYLNSPFCAKVREILYKHGMIQEDERPKVKYEDMIKGKPQ